MVIQAYSCDLFFLTGKCMLLDFLPFFNCLMQTEKFQLRHLQGRQGQLLSMKEEAEKRLKEAETRDNQG